MNYTVKIPVGLVSVLAGQREKVTEYNVHRGFKALAFYCHLRKLTTSSGIYGMGSKSTWDFYKEIAQCMPLSFNTVKTRAATADNFGFIKNGPDGFELIAIEKIAAAYGCHQIDGEYEFHELTFNEYTNLEHELKTLVIKENYMKQEYCCAKKLNQIPTEKHHLLDRFIEGWRKLPLRELYKRIVEVQRHLFADFKDQVVKYGTEVYDFFHRIHADVTLSTNGLERIFGFTDNKSVQHLKKMLLRKDLVQITHRSVNGSATRLPHESDGSIKPIKTIYLKSQKQRRWIQPDLITLKLNLKSPN